MVRIVKDYVVKRFHYVVMYCLFVITLFIVLLMAVNIFQFSYNVRMAIYISILLIASSMLVKYKRILNEYEQEEE